MFDHANSWPLICSVCEGPLFTAQRVMRCNQGHTFDIAREGYVNLLTARHAERGITGDTRTMLHARRRFLDAGYFGPLLELLAERVQHVLQHVSGDPCIVEVGCGEGYYIGNLALETGKSTARQARYIGFDVSKDAVRLAARRYKRVQFAVANVRRRLYVAPGAVHVLLSIFAPRHPEEFRRIIAPDGRFIVVFPGYRHMEHIRSRYELLQVEEEKEERILSQFGGYFTLESRQVLEYPLTVTGDHVRDFVSMGPNAWHTQAETVQPAPDIATVASFVILQFAPLS